MKKKPIKLYFTTFYHHHIDSKAILPIKLANGTGHLVTISNLEEFEACANIDKLNQTRSFTLNLEDKNPCQ
jgi:hypothetical protein